MNIISTGGLFNSAKPKRNLSPQRSAKRLKRMQTVGDDVFDFNAANAAIMASMRTSDAKFTADNAAIDAKFTADNAAIMDSMRTSDAKFTADLRTSSDKFTADNAAIAQAISNPAAAALQTSVAGTDTRVVPTTVTLPPSSSTSTPSTGTSPLTIAAIGFGVLKLLAII